MFVVEDMISILPSFISSPIAWVKSEDEYIKSTDEAFPIGGGGALVVSSKAPRLLE